MRRSQVQVLLLLILRLEHGLFGSCRLDIVIDDVDVDVILQLGISIDANVEIRTTKVIGQTGRHSSALVCRHYLRSLYIISFQG
mmetsp:Transcript_14948/g.14539  ORF Transcript_14948/g.14539 Transcript_14948/m.14539 type:complete len:84 (+) Transcript_14948:1953-2204(+)